MAPSKKSDPWAFSKPIDVIPDFILRTFPIFFKFSYANFVVYSLFKIDDFLYILPL